MEYAIYTGIGIVVIILFVILFCILNLKDTENKLDMAITKLMEIFNTEREYLVEEIDIIHEDEATKELIFSYEFDIFKYDQELYEKRKVISNLITEKSNDELDEIEKKLVLLTENMEGLKDFYNSNAKNFNYAFNKIPLKYIYKLFRFKEKTLFNHRKITEFEILND